MFSKKSKVDGTPGLSVVDGGRARGPRGISMLADGCTFIGRMFLQGESRIGGKVEGAVLSDGHLTIEESAQMKGEVTGVSVHLNGAVEGRVRVSDVLHVSSTGRVKGEIFAKRLIVDDGGRIEGQLSAFEGDEATKGTTSDATRGHAKDKDGKAAVKAAG